MRRKDSAIQQQVANLQMKIVQEDRAVESRTTDLLTDWEKTKPVTVSVAKPACLQHSMGYCCQGWEAPLGLAFQN